MTPQVQLLSSAKLRITNRLLRARPVPDAVILRAAGRDQRLIVTPAQADTLTEGFAEFRSVPEVLVQAIAERRCPPLREFYELVVQAHAAGVLLTAPDDTAAHAALRWPVRLPVLFASLVANGAAVVSLVVLAATIPQWRGPGGWLDVVGGWLAACLLLSLGSVLAACAIAPFGEVRGARLWWRTRFPHFRIDEGEAIVGGSRAEVAVAALRAAPVLVGAAVAALKFPGWLPALCGGALFVLAPFGSSAARQWLASRRRTPPYSVRTDFLFEPSRADWWARGAAHVRGFMDAFGWRGLAWTVLWLAWSFVSFTQCMPQTAAAAKAWLVGAPRPVHLGAEYLLLIAIAAGLVGSLSVWVKHWWLQRTWSRPLHSADARDRHRPPLTGEPAEMLAQAPLFQKLDPASRAALAAAMQPVECGAGDELTREDEPGDDFFFVVAGELAVRKRLPGKRRSVTVGWLGPGDGFGEVALLENTARIATIVASRPSRLLRLGRADFDRLVVSRLGAERIRELLQHARFLGRMTFTAGWSLTELVKFAQRCRTVRVDAGLAPINQGEPNQWFYLIYDGAFEARAGARVLRRMGPGDYFGEISLLEGVSATATVVALEESRCLVLGRTDFLELFARDFRISLRMEAVAGQRLGAGVFATR